MPTSPKNEYKRFKSGPWATAPVSSFQSLETDWGILFYNKTTTNLSGASKICQPIRVQRQPKSNGLRICTFSSISSVSLTWNATRTTNYMKSSNSSAPCSAAVSRHNEPAWAMQPQSCLLTPMECNNLKGCWFLYCMWATMSGNASSSLFKLCRVWCRKINSLWSVVRPFHKTVSTLTPVIYIWIDIIHSSIIQSYTS